jgi:hypothetical protein
MDNTIKRRHTPKKAEIWSDEEKKNKSYDIFI